MNKQQEKQYNEYVKDCEVNNETPISKEDFVKELDAQEKQEKQNYLNYQSRTGKANDEIRTKAEVSGLPSEDVKLIKIMTKEEWLKAGKPTGETKHEKFVRLVEKRTGKALDSINNLFSLKSPQYESNLEERKQVIQALNDAVKKLENHFTGQKEVSTGFKLQPLPVLEKPQ